MENFIEGFKELERKLGYEPDFHDDYIEKVTITSDRMEFDLKTENGILYSLIFDGVKEIHLEGEIDSMAGIIFGLEITQIDKMLKTDIDASVGLCGDIISKRIAVK